MLRENSNLNSVELYINEIQQFPLLTEIEFNKLLNDYHNGNLKAKEKIINSNLRLVVSIAKKVSPSTSSMELLDLIQEGSIGLTKAIESYDKEKSVFSTYAYEYILGYMLKSVREKDKMIRRPTYLYDMSKKYDQFIKEYYNSRHEYPSDEVLKETFNVKDETLDYLKKKDNYNVDSYNKKIENSDNKQDEIAYFIPGEVDEYNNLIESMHLFDYLNVIKDVLNDGEYYILYYKILVDKESKLTNQCIAEKFNVAKQRIDSRKKAILKKIKPYSDSESNMFRERLECIKAFYGDIYDKLDISPLEPEKICLFLYLKDNVSSLERQMIYFMLIHKINYDTKDLQEIFGIDEKVVNDLYNKVLKLLNDTINSIDFIEYKNNLLKELGYNIYKQELLSPEETYKIRMLLK